MNFKYRLILLFLTRDYDILFLEPIIVPFSHCGHLKCFESTLATQKSSDLELTAILGFEDTPKLKPHILHSV